jgi:uncharacterized phage protein gp47/JayE
MIFRKDYGTLVNKSLQQLLAKSRITNQTVGGIARSIIEVINLNISEYYDILDINTAMGFLSTAEGYFLDLIGDLLNVKRIPASSASVSDSDMVQKFYVSTGSLGDVIGSYFIPSGTQVSTEDGTIVYTVTSDTSFSPSSTFIYAPIIALETGSNYNVGVNVLTKTSLGINGVFTTNEKVVSSGTDVETDDNYRFRIANATLSAEKANQTAVRLACLSVSGVADILVREYARGIGSFDVIVIPSDGIATDKMISDVQAAIDLVQAIGVDGKAIKPSIVPVEIEVRLVFVNNVVNSDRESIKLAVKSAVERYIVNIPIGNTFILNELRQRIMDVDERIKDHVISCYYFRRQPVFLGNVEIYWDEMFYPDTQSTEAIRVL